MKPCKHLDHDEENYPTAKLVAIDELSSKVKHWGRKEPSGNCFVCPRCKRITTEADMVYTEGNCIEYGNLCDYDELLCATIKQ